MDQGNEMRAVASTAMNATSSRSHSIFIIKMQQKQVTTPPYYTAYYTPLLPPPYYHQDAAEAGARTPLLHPYAPSHPHTLTTSPPHRPSGDRPYYIPYYTQVIAGQQKETRATINLVDLAGSERVAKTGATGDKLKEGANT